MKSLQRIQSIVNSGFIGEYNTLLDQFTNMTIDPSELGIVEQIISVYEDLEDYKGLENLASRIDKNGRETGSSIIQLYAKTIMAHVLCRTYRSEESQILIEKILSELKELGQNKQKIYLSAHALFTLGIIFWNKSQYEDGLATYYESLSYFKNLSNIKYEARLHNNIGILHYNKGNTAEAMKHYEMAVNRFKQLNNKILVGMVYVNMSTIFHHQGKYEETLNYSNRTIHNTLLFRDSRAVYKPLAFAYRNKGRAFFSLENYSEALNSFLQAQKYFSLLELNLVIPQNYFQIFQVYKILSDENGMRIYFDKLEQIHKNFPSPPAYCYYNLALATITKDKTSMKYKVKAANILIELLDSESCVAIEIQMPVILNYIELLMLEITLFNDEESFKILNQYLVLLTEKATQANSLRFLIDSLIIKSKVAIINLEIDEARTHLIQAKAIALSIGNNEIDEIITNELENIDHNEDQIKSFKEKNPPLQDRLKLGKFMEEFKRFVAQKSIFQVTNKIENPKVLIVINDSGLNALTVKFDQNIILQNELLANFISAINTFGMQVFNSNETIDLIKYKEFNIAVKYYYGTGFAYIFEGDASYAYHKVERICEEFFSSRSIWKKLTDISFDGLKINIHDYPILLEKIHEIIES